MENVKDKKIKVLMVSGSYPPIHCGVADGTKLLCRHLAMREDVSVSVLTSDKADKDTDEKITTYNIINKWYGLKYLRRFLKVVKDINPDVIHFQFPASEYKNSSFANFIFLPFLLRLKKRRVVYTLHEYTYNGKMSKLARIPAILFSDAVVVVEEAYKREIKKQYKRLIDQDKVSVIHIGSNIPRSVASMEHIRELREKYLASRPLNTKILSFFGWINDKKCLDIVFTAFAELKKEEKLNSVFLIMGDFNGEKCGERLFLSLTKIIKENGLEENVIPVGYLADSEVGDYFRASDAALLLFKDGVSPRNGSMLAAKQEGTKIITTKPVSEESLFEGEQFTLIGNSVQEVKDAVFCVQNSPSVKYEVESSDAEWDVIAEKYTGRYRYVIDKRKRKK